MGHFATTLAAFLVSSGAALLVASVCPARADKTADDLIDRSRLPREVLSGIGRHPRADPQDARDRGMIETGLRPVFADGVTCRAIDEGWAIDYTRRRGREAMHGGIDIPAATGTPVLAVADGVVVAKLAGDNNPRGIEIWLRHAPEQTGRPFWIYTQYTHLLAIPPLALGERVRMGQEIGKTSNTGISNAEARERHGDGRQSPGGKHSAAKSKKERRPALHFAVLYAAGPKFMRNDRVVIPLDGYWMDPNALYRSAPPYDSQRLKALPNREKAVPIPYITPDGKTFPQDTKLIWPYPCVPR